jgi:small conductance mechanosensitive channel
VFRYVTGVFILGGGLVMLLDEAGVPIVPLMGGAAVVGLAVAFGAQNLIKDYFSGFMLLMEDQYGVNDVVRIGDTAGTVEQISLRVTVLRDLEGVRHFIPHGSITRVSNLTHTWSRAFFKIPVGCSVDVDRAMRLLMELARDLRSDPIYGGFILEEPEMLGVDAFDSSGMLIKFYLKTRPLRQWTIKREMLRRIKKRFDIEGIESPFSPLPAPPPARKEELHSQAEDRLELRKAS